MHNHVMINKIEYIPFEIGTYIDLDIIKNKYKIYNQDTTDYEIIYPKRDKRIYNNELKSINISLNKDDKMNENYDSHKNKLIKVYNQKKVNNNLLKDNMKGMGKIKEIPNVRGIKNTNNECFGIAAVQFLLNCFNKEILCSIPRKRIDYIGELVLIRNQYKSIRKKSLIITSFLKKINNNNIDSSYDDPLLIIERILRDILNEYHFTIGNSYQCCKCNHIISESVDMCYLNWNDILGKHNVIKSRYCVKCKKNQKQLQIALFVLKDFLLVVNDKKIFYKYNEYIQFDKIIYKAKSVVIYENKNHYTAAISRFTSNNWFLCNYHFY